MIRTLNYVERDTAGTTIYLHPANILNDLDIVESCLLELKQFRRLLK